MIFPFPRQDDFNRNVMNYVLLLRTDGGDLEGWTQLGIDCGYAITRRLNGMK